MAKAAKVKNTNRQAVVVVHGIGEQKPGETLDNILRGLGKADALGAARLVYVPDRRTGSRELYRVTTVNSGDDDGRRTDFYEFYWADIMAGNTLDHVKAWVFGLLLKRRRDVPNNVVRAWYALWAITLVISALAVWTVLTIIDNTHYPTLAFAGKWVAFIIFSAMLLCTFLRKGRDHKERAVSTVLRLAFGAVVVIPLIWLDIHTKLLGHPALYTGSGLALIVYFVGQFVVPYVGDVARYTRITPETVAKRAEVMNRGLDLLRALHGMAPKSHESAADADAVPDYDRVVVVSHSLGSIIAYDLLRHLWMECGPVRGGVKSPQAIRSLKRLGAKMAAWENGDVAFDLAELRSAQREACADLAQKVNGWRVSDFVTIGSPLTHADFLVANDAESFQRLFEKGQLVRLPPRLYNASGQMLTAKESGENPVVYQSGGETHARHTAAFAATRWTNIYDDPKSGVFKGDVVSGRLATLFGLGISDVDMTIKKSSGKNSLVNRLFTHTSYWLPESRAVNIQAPDWMKEKLGLDADKHHLDVLAAAMDINEKVRPETREA